MQVYKYMDIGTAKITPEEMQGIPHYLVDVIDPKDDFNVVIFQQMAKAALEQIYANGHIPILVGGTGFYIQALLYDIDFTQENESPQIRRELTRQAQEEGPEVLYEELKVIDPDSAAVLHPHNIKRVIRAIEYYRLTGERISVHNEREKARKSPYDFHYFVLNMDREKLYRRIDRRVDLMMEQGLVEEVKKLQAMGCHKDMISMQGLGYKEILSYLDGEITLERAVYLLKRDTRHFAKRQLTWFKREPDAIWIPADEQPLENVLNVIKGED